MVMKSSDTISKEMNTNAQNAECINGSNREKDAFHGVNMTNKRR